MTEPRSLDERISSICKDWAKAVGEGQTSPHQKAISARRIRSAVAFMALGTSALLSIYYLLPQLVNRISARTFENVTTKGNEVIDALKRALSDPALDQLQKNVSDIQSLSASASSALLEVQRNLPRVATMYESLEASEKQITSTLELMKASIGTIERAPLLATSKESAGTPAVLEELKTGASNVVNAISGLATIPELSKLLESESGSVGAFEAFSVALNRVAESKIGEKLRTIADGGKISEFKDEEKKLLAQLIKPGEAIKDAGTRLQTLRESLRKYAEKERAAADSLSTYTTSLASSTAVLSQSVPRLAELIVQVKANEVALKEQVANAKTGLDGLTAALAESEKTAKGVKELGNLTTRVNQQLTSFADATGAVNDSVANVRFALDDLRKVGGLSSGPVVFFVLFLAGMFSIFAIRLILNWSKSAEEAKAEIDRPYQWQIIATITEHCVANKLDASVVLGALEQKVIDRSNSRLPETALSGTLNEIARLLRELVKAPGSS